MNGSVDGPNLVESSICVACGENYLLRGEKFVRLIKRQRALNIRMREGPQGYGPQRVCFSVVPLYETINACVSCWLQEQNRELSQYALAPFAGYIAGESIG